jgi:hypothetical protein
MALETRISVPTRDLEAVTCMLAKAGCIVLDRGERTTTDDGEDAEATCHVLYLGEEAVAAEAETTRLEA